MIIRCSAVELNFIARIADRCGECSLTLSRKIDTLDSDQSKTLRLTLQKPLIKILLLVCPSSNKVTPLKEKKNEKECIITMEMHAANVCRRQRPKKCQTCHATHIASEDIVGKFVNSLTFISRTASLELL